MARRDSSQMIEALLATLVTRTQTHENIERARSLLTQLFNYPDFDQLRLAVPMAVYLMTLNEATWPDNLTCATLLDFCKPRCVAYRIMVSLGERETYDPATEFLMGSATQYYAQQNGYKPIPKPPAPGSSPWRFRLYRARYWLKDLTWHRTKSDSISSPPSGHDQDLL